VPRHSPICGGINNANNLFPFEIERLSIMVGTVSNGQRNHKNVRPRVRPEIPKPRVLLGAIVELHETLLSTSRLLVDLRHEDSVARAPFAKDFGTRSILRKLSRPGKLADGETMKTG